MTKRPLADRIRPQNLDDIIGQAHLLGKTKALRKIIDSGIETNLAFFGPPGTGKTTLANIISQKSQKLLKKLNCTSASTSDIKQIISELDTFTTPNGIVLYLDEIQYFNRKQQQTLLEFVEKGKITLIISTTENPYFYIHGALLSRMTVFEFKAVSKEQIILALKRAFPVLQNDYNQELYIEDDALECIARSAAGDVRKAINILELAAVSAETDKQKRKISMDVILQLGTHSAGKYDRAGDEHYDLLSAFQKSMRGSDPDAALHYLARLLESGDLPSVCRRLLVCACEDVGLAYIHATAFVKTCVDIAFQVGLPEARIPLADAVVLVCLSPKSNSAYTAINAAIKDVRSGAFSPVPRHLQNKHFDGADNSNKGQFYKYPHDFENHYIQQQYLPNEMKNVRYYQFGQNKNEQFFKKFWESMR